MGRYYQGDINGKFMFAVQSSTSASRFGAEYHEPNYVDYYFTMEEHYEQVTNELSQIDHKYGKYIKLIEDFFEENDSWNDQMVIEYFRKHNEKYKGEYMSEYADYRLGNQIKECLEANDYCEFQAEL